VFLHSLVGTVVEQFGDAFPELKRDPQKVRSIIYEEEEGFLRTLERGLRLFNDAAKDAHGTGSKTINSKTAFDLHTEQGVFIDITEQMAGEAGLKVDRSGYDKLFKEFQERSSQGRTKLVVTAIKGELPNTDDASKHSLTPISACVVGYVLNNEVKRDGVLSPGDTCAVLLDRTNFYGEQGGQVGDVGVIRSVGGAEFEVTDTQRLGDAVLHIGVLHEGKLAVGDKVTISQTIARRVETARNHTATHLLNHALRTVLGGDVEQKGSLVDNEKTRFDFSHDRPLSPDELRGVELLVNQQIIRDQIVSAHTMPLTEARKLPGLRAVFGEKYPDPVRVVLVGAESPEHVNLDNSVEFCGGTHVSVTGSIGFFKITSQEGVAKGVRRVTATTGRGSLAVLQKLSSVAEELSSRFNCRFDEVPARIESLQDEIKKLQKQIQKGTAGDLNTAGDKLVEEAKTFGASKLIVGEVPGAPVEQIRAQVDRIRQKVGSSLIVLGWKNEEGGGGFLVGVTDDLVKKGIKAGDIIKPVAEIAGGKGGGPPNMATAGARDMSKLAEALAKAVELATAKLS